MHTATLRLELRVDACETVRQKRRLLEEMVAHLRRHFNVSAAEVDRLDRPSEAVLAVAAVGRTRRESREVLQRVAEAVGVHPHAHLVSQALYEMR
jgi:uncharacterized protein YlxP (DUF503 family)